MRRQHTPTVNCCKLRKINHLFPLSYLDFTCRCICSITGCAAASVVAFVFNLAPPLPETICSKWPVSNFRLQSGSPNRPKFEWEARCYNGLRRLFFFFLSFSFVLSQLSLSLSQLQLLSRVKLESCAKTTTSG